MVSGSHPQTCVSMDAEHRLWPEGLLNLQKIQCAVSLLYSTYFDCATPRKDPEVDGLLFFPIVEYFCDTKKDLPAQIHIPQKTSCEKVWPKNNLVKHSKWKWKKLFSVVKSTTDIRHGMNQRATYPRMKFQVPTLEHLPEITGSDTIVQSQGGVKSNANNPSQYIVVFYMLLIHIHTPYDCNTQTHTHTTPTEPPKTSPFRNDSDMGVGLTERGLKKNQQQPPQHTFEKHIVWKWLH